MSDGEYLLRKFHHRGTETHGDTEKFANYGTTSFCLELRLKGYLWSVRSPTVREGESCEKLLSKPGCALGELPSLTVGLLTPRASPKKKTPRFSKAAASVAQDNILLCLRSSCVLPVQLQAQPFEIGVKRYETRHPLKERLAPRFVRNAIEGALAITSREMAPAGQTN